MGSWCAPALQTDACGAALRTPKHPRAPDPWLLAVGAHYYPAPILMQIKPQATEPRISRVVCPRLRFDKLSCFPVNRAESFQAPPHFSCCQIRDVGRSRTSRTQRVFTCVRLAKSFPLQPAAQLLGPSGNAPCQPETSTRLVRERTASSCLAAAAAEAFSLPASAPCGTGHGAQRTCGLTQPS